MYKKDPLIEVICLVRFETPLDEQDIIGKINSENEFEYFKKTYPKLSKKILVTNEISFNTEISDVKLSEINIKNFILSDNSDEEKPNIITINKNDAKIMYRNYPGHERLYSDFSELIKRLKGLGLKEIKYLGLRFRNLLNINGIEGIGRKNYVSDNLLGTVEFTTKLDKDIARIMSQIVLKYEECNIFLNYGFWNKDFPSKILTWDFTIDIDARSILKINLEEDDINGYVQKYHDYIKEIFEASIKDEYRNYLNS